MVATHVLTPTTKMALHGAALDLHTEFRAVFGQEIIEAMLRDSYAELQDSYAELAATATMISTERFASQRLQALAHTENYASGKKPAVLFLCTNNAGLSQMALGWFSHLAAGKAMAWSAGTAPGSPIHRGVTTAMAEAGIDITGEFSKPWTEEFLLAADVVITTGCRDACPVLSGKRYEDWELDDPAGKTMDEIRAIRDLTKDRVVRLVSELTGQSPPAVTD